MSGIVPRQQAGALRLNLARGGVAITPRDEPPVEPASDARPAIPLIADSRASGTIAGTFQGVIDGLPAEVAILDMRSTIIAVNRAWASFAPDAAPDCIGANYVAICRACEDSCPEAGVVRRGLERLLAGKRRTFRHIYRMQRGSAESHYLLVASLFEFEATPFVIVSHYDISDFAERRQARRALSAQLLDAQAEERRRIARELHDTTAQHLIAAEFGLAELKAQHGGEGGAAYDRIAAALARAHQEIRTLSYLLYPPGLESGALTDALETLVAGFAKRSGTKAAFAHAGGSARSPAIEATLFRVAQEALANVQKHAGARSVAVRLDNGSSAMTLEVEDDGVGLDASALARAPETLGLGLRSMRERVEAVGGRFEVKALATGTLVSVIIPRKEELGL